MKGIPMRVLMAAILAAALLFGAVACSKKEEATPKKEDLSKTTEMQKSKPAAIERNYDSLAAIVAPIRNQQNPFVTLTTDYGDMVLELYRDVARAHVDSFIARTEEGFYDGTLFFRVYQHFMIQGGDPNNNGTGNAGYYLKGEFSDLPHVEGTLSMARGRDPNSASCQFFICLDRNHMTQNLDGEYTVFGHLIRGYDALHRIGSTECGPNPTNPAERSRPKRDIQLTRAFMSDSEGNPI